MKAFVNDLNKHHIDPDGQLHQTSSTNEYIYITKCTSFNVGLESSKVGSILLLHREMPLCSSRIVLKINSAGRNINVELHTVCN